MASGSAKSQGGHIQEPVHGRGHYEAHEEEEESSSAADAAIPAANEGAANAPSPPVETLAKRLLREQPGGGGRGAEVSASASPVGDREGKKTSGAIEGGANASSPPPAASLPFKHLAKGWLPREQPGGGGRGAEGSASASPVGDREGKKTSAATESGPHASSPPPAASPGERLAKRLPHDHRGGGGRGSEGSTSPSPVVDRKGKKICVDTQGGASASSPPPALVPTFESLFERLLREQPGDGGRGTEGSTSASAAVVDQEERGEVERPRFSVSTLCYLEAGARSQGHLTDLGADAQEGSSTVLSSAVRNFSADFSWCSIMGNPMVQTIPNTCAIVAFVVCIEALLRLELEWERLHCPGTFPCRAAAPRKLRRACLRHNI